MPSTPKPINLFLEIEDMEHIVAQLSADNEVAFLLSAGPADPTKPRRYQEHYRRWRAYRALPLPFDPNRKYTLWHIPSGSVFVENSGPSRKWDEATQTFIQQPRYLDIDDPFDGWNGPSYTGNPDNPAMNNAPQFFTIEFARNAFHHPELLGISNISWIGSYCTKAPESACTFWKKLQRLLKKGAKKVSGDGKTSLKDEDYLCWPAAYERLRFEAPERLRL